MAFVYGVHHDPENYKDPEKFLPERWIDENGKFQYQPYKFIPFSMGPRVCLGESLARADLQLFTAMLFHRYEFIPVGEGKFVAPIKGFGFGMDTEMFKLKLKHRH